MAACSLPGTVWQWLKEEKPVDREHGPGLRRPGSQPRRAGLRALSLLLHSWLRHQLAAGARMNHPQPSVAETGLPDWTAPRVLMLDP